MKVKNVLMLIFVFVGLMSIVSFASNENNAFMKKDIDVYNINNKCHITIFILKKGGQLCIKELWLQRLLSF